MDLLINPKNLGPLMWPRVIFCATAVKLGYMVFSHSYSFSFFTIT